MSCAADANPQAFTYSNTIRAMVLKSCHFDFHYDTYTSGANRLEPWSRAASFCI